MKMVRKKELENYLIERQSLQGLVLLMDIRHPLQHFDVMMLQWAHSRQLFVHVLLTKSDKLNRGPASKVLQEVQLQLRKMKLQFSIQLFSSMNKQGLEELASIMAGRLNFTLEQATEFDLSSIAEASADDADDEDLDPQDLDFDVDVDVDVDQRTADESTDAMQSNPEN